jgi:hypothetical protein
MKNYLRVLWNGGAGSDLARAGILSVALLFVFTLAYQVYSASVTLSATVLPSITFTISTNQFASINPGTVSWATTTLDVLTNDTSGWNVTLSGSNKVTGHNNFQNTGDTAEITDQTEWVPGAATTTAGTGVTQASLASAGNVFAFRVMTASSTNGGAFVAPSWWGANDSTASALYAGVSSSTVSRQIGNAGVGSYGATDHLNTVLYYLQVGATQPSGTYSAPLTYTATAN